MEKEFFGRREEIAEFQEFLLSDKKILNIHGIAGIGKHSFIVHVLDKLEFVNTRIELGTGLYSPEQGIIDIMERIMNKLSDAHKYSFPLFELCRLIYKKTSGRPINVKQESKLFGELNETLENIPGMHIPVNVISAIIKRLTGGGQNLRKNYLLKKNPDIKTIITAKENEIVGLMVEYFMKDLDANMNPNSEVVLCIERFDKLIDLDVYGSPLVDKFLNTFNEADNVKLMVSSTSRIDREGISHIQLNNFNEEEVLEILKSFNVGGCTFDFDTQTDENLISIYHATRGYPLLLRLYLEKIKAGILDRNNLAEVDLNDLGLNKYLNEICKGDNAIKDVLDLLSCLGQWNKKDLNEIAQSINMHMSPNTLSSLYNTFLIRKKEDTDDEFYIVDRFLAQIFYQCNPDIKSRLEKLLTSKLDKLKAIGIVDTLSRYPEMVMLITKDNYAEHERNKIEFSKLIDYTLFSDFENLEKNMLLMDYLGKQYEMAGIAPLSLDYYQMALSCASRMFNGVRNCHTYWNLRNCMKALAEHYFKFGKTKEGLIALLQKLHYSFLCTAFDENEVNALKLLGRDCNDFLRRAIECGDMAAGHEVLNYFNSYMVNQFNTSQDENILAILTWYMTKFSLLLKDKSDLLNEARCVLHIFQDIETFRNIIAEQKESLLPISEQNNVLLDECYKYCSNRLHQIKEAVIEVIDSDAQYDGIVIDFTKIELIPSAELKKIEDKIREEKNLGIRNDGEFISKILKESGVKIVGSDSLKHDVHEDD